MRFPWSKSVPPEDPEVRRLRQVAASNLRDVVTPSAAALAILRRAYPGLAVAERELVAAEERQRKAVDECAETERRTREICSGVASGRTTATAAERALVAAKAAALGLDGFAEVVANARGRVLVETAVAVVAAASSLKARREAIEKRVAPLRKVLEGAVAEIATIDNEALALVTASGASLLAGRDVGPLVDWPLSPNSAATLREWMQARPLGLRPLRPAAPAPSPTTGDAA